MNLFYKAITTACYLTALAATWVILTSEKVGGFDTVSVLLIWGTAAGMHYLSSANLDGRSYNSSDKQEPGH